MSARILIIDIETRPILGYVWSLWKQNVGLNQIAEDWEIITYAAKWLDDDYIYYDTAYGQKDDKLMMESLWHLLDEADIIIAHNGERFDIPKINARFLKYKMKPPSPYKQIDTLKVAKRNFRLTSNRLDYVARLLGYGGKLETGGMQLWVDCMNGIKSAWERMLEYNIHDVQILEWVYLEMRPWMHNHPNLALYDDDEETRCPACGGKHINYRGYAYTPVGRYRRFVCVDCGKWGRSAANELSKEKRRSLGRNIA